MNEQELQRLGWYARFATFEENHSIPNRIYLLAYRDPPSSLIVRIPPPPPPPPKPPCYEVFTARGCGYDVPESREEELREVLKDAELFFQDPAFARVRYSAQIEDALIAKMKTARKGEIERASRILTGVHSRSYVLGARDALRDGEQSSITYVVQPDKKTYVFQGTSEDEVCERILSLADKKMAPTPKKVLVKMLALRLQQIRKGVVARQTQIREALRHALPNDIRHQDPKYKEFLAYRLPDFERGPQVIEFLNTKRRWLRDNSIPVNVDDTLELMSRPNMEDDVVQEAWGLIVAGEVMES